MNATEITNERLLEISSFYGGNEVGILARAELDRRKAEEAKPEPVVRWAMAGNTKAIARIEGHDIVERVWPCGVKRNTTVPFGANEPWTMPGDIDLTEERYNQLKAEYLKEEAKPEPVASFCHDCGTSHEGNCVNTSEAKEPAPTHQPDCAISLMPPPPEEGYRYDLQALHDKLNEIIAAVNRLAKEGK